MYKCQILMYGNINIKKGYYKGIKIYSYGNSVTYYVDTNSVYTEEFDEGDNVLSPVSFTPSKSGWSFSGWRKDNEPEESGLSNLLMEDDAITLYAVFTQTVTVSYDGNGNTDGSVSQQTGTRYYNNGTTASPTFVIAENSFIKDGYLFYRWALNSVDGTQFKSGAKITFDSVTTATFYANWVQSTANVYNYTGDIQLFTVPCDGIYQFEVWGAKGGSSYLGVNGGLGGYAVGNAQLNKGTNLYVVVGGQGLTPYATYDNDGDVIEILNTSGGYNGGGSGTDECGTGGGATHIGTFESTLAAHGTTSGLYIVAGGGGAGFSSGGYNIGSDASNGGCGGGEEGGRGYYGWGISNGYNESQIGGGGGTQSCGGECYIWDDSENTSILYENSDTYLPSFGQGGGNNQVVGLGQGGGGGLYGGGFATGPIGAGGGSGYIGGVSDGSMESGIRDGDGYATITLLSVS
ncbi:MAG: InlB B-repeat-containing protein [Lachnospiraceae bacterium]|nr:InlB B-repeat-containing protein [Lachnospiraceae bacterium]